MHSRGLGPTLVLLLLTSTLLVGCATLPGPTPASTPAAALEEEKVEWDLVLFSDSSGWGVAELYAAHIEEDLDVTVQVHDLAADSLGAGTVLTALRGENSPYPNMPGVPDTCSSRPGATAMASWPRG